MRALVNLKSAILIICFLAMGCFSNLLRAQDYAHFEPWTTFTTQQYLKKAGFWLRNDFSIRPAFDDDFNVLFMVRPRAIVDLWDIIDLHVAIDFRYTRYTELENTIEMRPWEGLQLHWPDIGRVRFDHFYRFEQRFHWKEGFERDKIALRSRYRLRMHIPLNNPRTTDHTYFTRVSAEAFIPHGETFEETYASTFRLGLALGYNQNNKWRYHLNSYLDRGRNTVEDRAEASRFIVEAWVRRAF
jgi:hypothetical protein